MNLTYQVEENKYTIINSGVVWIVQDGYFPYPGETIAEKAQAHINEILISNEQAEIETVTFEQLKATNETLLAAVSEMTEYIATQDLRLTDQENAITELSTLIAMGGM